LIDKETVMALNGLGSMAAVGAVLPILAEKKVPLICTYSGSPALRAKAHPYFFTTMASYRDEVVQMVRNLVTLQKTRIGPIYQNALFGRLMLPVVEEVVKELGATLVGRQTFEPNGSDAVGDDTCGIAITNIVPYLWRQTAALTRDYAAAMQRANIGIDYDHLFGYLNMRILLEGLRRAGKQLSSETLVKAMEGVGKFDFGGYPLNYGPQKHHGSNSFEITIVSPGGRYMR
jgi:ABC-type branched-subunit amino acid transport system substrate-binding protein